MGILSRELRQSKTKGDKTDVSNIIKKVFRGKDGGLVLEHLINYYCTPKTDKVAIEDLSFINGQQSVVARILNIVNQKD